MKPETHTDSSDTHDFPSNGPCPVLSLTSVCHDLEGWFPQADLRHAYAPLVSPIPRLLAEPQEKEPELLSSGCPNVWPTSPAPPDRERFSSVLPPAAVFVSLASDRQPGPHPSIQWLGPSLGPKAASHSIGGSTPEPLSTTGRAAPIVAGGQTPEWNPIISSAVLARSCLAISSTVPPRTVQDASRLPGA